MSQYLNSSPDLKEMLHVVTKMCWSSGLDAETSPAPLVNQKKRAILRTSIASIASELDMQSAVAQG